MSLKRWPPDPLRVVVATALLFVVGAVTLVTMANPVMDLEELELAAEAAEARARARAESAIPAPSSTPPPPEPEAARPPPRTRKGKILQERLEERRAKLASASGTSRAEAPRVSLRAGGAEAALVERALKRKLGATFVDDSAARWALTLRVDRKPGAGVQLKCSVAVAAMPNKNLVASFSSQVGVEGEVAEAELLGDAADACAGALAEDLGPWLRRTP